MAWLRQLYNPWGVEQMIQITARAWKWVGMYYAIACGLSCLLWAPIVLGQNVLRLLTVAPATSTRRILILNEVGTQHPAIPLIDQHIHAALQNSPYRIEWYKEYLDTIWFPEVGDQQRFQQSIIDKYRNLQPDVIITVGPSPLRFMAEKHKDAFPGIPIIFCLPNADSPGVPLLDADFTGVETELDAAETLKVALALRPDTQHVFVIGGTSYYDRLQEAVVKAQLKQYQQSSDVSYLFDLTMPALLDRVHNLPDRSIVIFTAMGRDAAGTRFASSREASPAITAAANAPLFSLFDIYLNHGEIGGYLSSVADQGTVAGEMAFELLNGKKALDIPRQKSVIAYMFDWQALKRWGIKESALPAGSIVLNRPPSFRQAYKKYIFIAILVLLSQAVAMCAVAMRRLKRKRFESELAESEKRFRLVANTAPVMIWMSGPDKHYTYVNQRWLDFTGRPVAAELGDGWAESVHLDDLDNCMQTYVSAFDRRKSFTTEYRLRRREGDYRWIMNTGVPRINADGLFAGYIGSALDVTSRKLAEEALAGVGGKLIAVQEQERTRIAWELREDINQQLALLSVMLDQFQQNPPRSISETRSRVANFVDRVEDVSESIRALSDRLHSSELKYLGVVVAMRSLCRKFSAQHQVEVHFSHEAVPDDLPGEISLCLFRVMQEALMNALKHSGVKSFDVALRASNETIYLSVRDAGVGFDTVEGLKGYGIGLTSIRERTRFVNGKVIIHSEPNAGTTIEVEVPLKSELAQATWLSPTVSEE
jgi:PAS domain S-box-containing protein